MDMRRQMAAIDLVGRLGWQRLKMGGQAVGAGNGPQALHHRHFAIVSRRARALTRGIGVTQQHRCHWSPGVDRRLEQRAVKGQHLCAVRGRAFRENGHQIAGAQALYDVGARLRRRCARAARQE